MDTYTPSFYARMTDPDLTIRQSKYTLEKMEKSVLADLEDLLNTKRPYKGIYDNLILVESSVVNYGIHDVTMINGESTEERFQFANHVKDVIIEYEPRLKNIEVEVRGAEQLKELPGGAKPGSIYFRIKATLDLDPNPVENVIFDTVLHVSTGQHEVSLPGAT